MSNCAKVSLTGRLIKDPVSKNWQNTNVVSFTIAVNTTKKEGDNYLSDFYNISVWGKPAEFIFPRITKGSLVQVYGDLIMQPYEDKNGNKTQSPNVRAIDVIPLSPNKTKQNAPTDEGVGF